MKILNFKKSAFVLFLFIVLIFIFGYLNKQNKKQDNFSDKPTTEFPSDCVSKTENLEVRGSSLAPLVKSGQTIKLLYGYYQCHPVERDDIVVYKYASNSAPIIKIVKGLENDKFQLQESKTGCWNVLINGAAIQNSIGEKYCFNEKARGMLSLYERDYRGAIPKNAYFILGNLANGSLDSSHFGLIDKSDILGKAVF